MTDNLVLLINKLSYQIVSRDLGREKINKLKDEREFKRFLKKIKQKGCDVLLGKSCEPSLPDPCLTDYGANWSPLTLVMDFGRELKEKGEEKLHDVLMSSVKCLEEKDYDCVNELLKFLMLLKGTQESSSTTQKDTAKWSGSDLFLSSSETFSIFSNEVHGCASEVLPRTTYRKAIQYEESWTKHFDSKFQVLGEFSKKNLLTPDKVSLDSLFTADCSINNSQSLSNSFVFTDFLSKKNHQSEKNLFDFNSDTFESETSLLDSFVDHPIAHKLPSLSFSGKGSLTKSECFAKSSDRFKRKLNLLPEDDSVRNFSEKNVTCKEEEEVDKYSSKTSCIDLKRNSNCSHSFSILYEKSVNNKSRDSSLGSSESISTLRERRKGFFGGSVSNTKEIILGLWEQDQMLIKEFRPELATDYPNLRMISLSEFVEDVKYLLTGINSGTFQYDTESECFNMKYGTCLEDVTPESLFHFSRMFLETGKCYIKLTNYATTICKNNFDICTTISQAFWKSISDILELYYSMVVEIPTSTNLLALKSCTRDLNDLITTIAAICKLSKSKESLPEGGELLTYLLQVAERVNKPCVRNTVFGILQNCCNVYFMCVLQMWMFKGHLEKQNNEFFVDYRQKTKTKSRTYYNSFYIDYNKIPSFFLGFEESIFNCGKSILFLKLFNPEDKFCQLLEKADYPNMCLCLSDSQLKQLENEFKNYGRRVLESCGESISIKTLKDEEREKEKLYIEYVKECKKIQEQEREQLRAQELKELKAKKELKNKMLNEQKLFIEAEKERKKLLEEEESRKIEEEAKKIKEKEENLLQLEKSSVVGFFEDLSKTIDRKIKFTNMRKKSLQRIIAKKCDNEEKSAGEHLMNSINDNEVGKSTRALDKEGNVILDVDVNSNRNVDSENNTNTNENPNTEDMVQLDDTDNLEFDENSNPSVDYGALEISSSVMVEPVEEKSDIDVEDVFPKTKSLHRTGKDEKLYKTVSNRTMASVEAQRNKQKVLSSEFDLELEKSEDQNSQKSKGIFSDIELNTNKIVQFEYQLIKKDSDVINVKPVESKTQIVEEKNFQPLKSETQRENEVSNFQSVIGLERKMECTNLGNSPEKQAEIEPKLQDIDSLTSFQTPPNGIVSEENISTFDSTELEVVITPYEEKQLRSLVINVDYRNALIRDAEISRNKRFYQNIFHSLRGKELDDLPCTDFTKFQRFLKKSVLIPLQVQEKLANDALLKHLLKGENLLSHLKSLRSYFFLNDGEFGRCFTHNIFRSLAKCSEPQQFFERSNLSNIVNEALNYTIHNADPNAQNLSFQIVKMPPFLNHSSHEVLSPFELSYKVDWPLNIIFTEKALSKYKMIFKFLLKLKRINWTLYENFLFLNLQFKNKKINRKVLACSPHYHKIQIYRHAMTQVIITLDDYIFSNGVQFPWMYFLKDLETTENIDHLYQKHVRYIKDVLSRCFLSKNCEDLLDYIHNLIELALKFHYTTKSALLEVVDGKYEHPKFNVLKTTFNEFCSVIKTFLRTLKEKISANQVLKSHYVLIEKFDLKLT